MESLHVRDDLPVVTAPRDGAYYVAEATSTITVSPLIRLVTLICRTGSAYVRESDDGTETLPGTWPPATDTMTGLPWMPLEAGTAQDRAEFAVPIKYVSDGGYQLRLNVQASSSVQVLFS